MQRAVFVLLTLCAPALAAADPKEADLAAAQAEVLAKAGDYTAAAAKFRIAWEADKLRPELFCNIGISLYKAKDLVRAYVLLEQCLEQPALDPKIFESVRNAMRPIEDVLRTSGNAPVRIVVEPRAASVEVAEFAPDVQFVGSRVVWLPAGTFHIAARAEGYADFTTAVVVDSAAARTVTIALHRSEPVPPVAHTVPVTPPVARAVPVIPAPSPRSGVAAISTTAVSTLAIGVAAYAAVAAHARAKQAGAAIDQATYDADRRAVLRWNTTVIVASSLGAVGAIASGYLWYRVLHKPGTRVALHANAHELGLAVTGRF